MRDMTSRKIKMIAELLLFRFRFRYKTWIQTIVWLLPTLHYKAISKDYLMLQLDIQLVLYLDSGHSATQLQESSFWKRLTHLRNEQSKNICMYDAYNFFRAQCSPCLGQSHHDVQACWTFEITFSPKWKKRQIDFNFFWQRMKK